MPFTFMTLVIALSTAHGALSLGLNCQGSSESHGKPGNIASLLVADINGAKDDTWFNDRQQIACEQKTCAFLQKTQGEPGRNLKGIAHYIADHGCGACGSVPVFYPGNNDVSAEELTFNYVSNPACTTGLCTF
jgi:hypothetical protein